MTVLARFANTSTGPTLAAVATVTVTPPSSPLVPGNTHQMLVGLYDASGNALADRVVSWESSDPAVGTVSTSGLVHALAVGTTTVTATSEGKTGSAVVLVIADGGGPGNLCQQIAGASVIAHGCLPHKAKAAGR